MQEKINQLNDLIKKAKSMGADAAEAVYVHGDSISANVQKQKIESFERADGHDLALRVIINKRQAVAATTDFRKESLDALVENAIAMAKHVPEDPFCCIADPDQLITQIPDVDSYDATAPDEEKLLQEAMTAEQAAFDVKGVHSSEGAGASWSATESCFVSSNGFVGSRKSSGWSISMVAVAGEQPDMQVDYDYSSKVYKSDLESPEKIGKEAGLRAVKRLKSRQAATGAFPVLFDPRVGTEIIGAFTGAINGLSVARGMSFLKDSLNKQVFHENITLVDDPLMPRGLRSRGADGEGLPTQKRHFIENGKLTSLVLDLSSAMQLKMNPTGNAARSSSGLPSPSVSNFYMQAGQQSAEDMIKSLDQAFLVTEMMGNGINGVTGDFSQGASGFWIEKGEIAYPVSEVTIAGNLKDMFMMITPANDLTFKYGINVPTMLIDKMTVAGK